MKAQLDYPALSEETGVGWDAVGPAQDGVLTPSDQGRTFASSSRCFRKIHIACSGQVLLHLQVAAAPIPRSASASMVQKLTGTVNSNHTVRLKFTIPASTTDVTCPATYAYDIVVPRGDFSKFVAPAQPSIDIVDRITHAGRPALTFLDAEDQGQIQVTYSF